MFNIIPLTRPVPLASPSRHEEIAVYGTVGPITVALTRRPDPMAALITVVVLGSAVGLEVVATLPDDTKGRAISDLVGAAVVRAVELAETEFTCPEAC